jgi:hypothetical protein
MASSLRDGSPHAHTHSQRQDTTRIEQAVLTNAMIGRSLTV